MVPVFRLQLTIYADYLAKNGNVLLIKGFHGIVFRLQTDAVLLPEESFYRGSVVVDESHDNLAVLGIVLLPDQYEIPIIDAGIDHAVSLYPEHEGLVLGADQSLGEGKYLLNVFLGENRDTGGHRADEWNGGILSPGFFIEDIDGARLGGVAFDQSVRFQLFQIAMNGGTGLQPNSVSYFTDGRRISIFQKEFLDVLKNLLLSFTGMTIVSHSIHLQMYIRFFSKYTTCMFDNKEDSQKFSQGNVSWDNIEGILISRCQDGTIYTRILQGVLIN